jgi:hypothetical protein
MGLPRHGLAMLHVASQSPVTSSWRRRPFRVGASLRRVGRMELPPIEGERASQLS